MKKDTKKMVGWGSLILFVLVIFWSLNMISLPGTNAIVDAQGGSYVLSDVTDLSSNGQVLFPGGAATVSGLVTNNGQVTKDVFIEAAFYAEKNIGLFATITPQPTPCVAEEKDSVTAIKVSGLAPGASQRFTIQAVVPTETSVLKPAGLNGSTISNWDDRFTELVGVYGACGEGYYDSISYSGLVVTSSTPTSPVKAESCEQTSDCSGWLLGQKECDSGTCVTPAPVAIGDSFAKAKAWIGKNQLLFLVIGFAALILVVALLMNDPKQRGP